MKNKTSQISKKEEIAQNPDSKIDEDFKGYPHGTATDETINPKTNQQKEIAGIGNKDGEKRTYRKKVVDEQDLDGSANAFEGKA